MAKKSQGFKKLVGAATIKDVMESGSYIVMTNGEHIFRIEATIVDGFPVLSMKSSKVVYYSVPRTRAPLRQPK